MVDLFKIILTATSISPIFVAFYFSNVVNSKSFKEGIGWLAIFGITIMSFYFVKRIAERKLERLPIEINHISPADKEISLFLLAYVLPFLGAGKLELWAQVVIVIVLFLAVLGLGGYYFNPILRLLGYHFYDVTLRGDDEWQTRLHSYILMTKRDVRDYKTIRKVIQIADNILMEVKN